MESPERTKVRRALDALKPYLAAYLGQRGVPTRSPGPRASEPDIHALLKAFRDNWDLRLRSELPRATNAYVHELIDVRNRWAHEEAFTPREVRRALDTVEQFASVIGAPERSGDAVAPSDAEQPAGTPSRRGSESQRDVMRRLYQEGGRDPERAVRAYAAAERAGGVRWKSNKHGIAAEDYARALLADGETKGWLM